MSCDAHMWNSLIIDHVTQTFILFYKATHAHKLTDYIKMRKAKVSTGNKRV